MLNIIQNNKGVIVPSEHLVLIEPFKTIWERDNDKHKKNAIKDFTFIEFMVSPVTSNPYKDLEKSKRSKAIIEEVFTNDYNPDELVYQAIELFEKWLNEYIFSYSFYKSALRGAKELKKFFLTVDLDERTKGGSAVYKPGDITRALKDLEDTIKNLQELEKRIFEEIKTTKTRGNKELNPFEV